MHRYGAISRIAAVALATAAALKVYGLSLAGRVMLAESSLSTSITAALIGFEFVLSAWLMVGMFREWTRRITIGAFSLFLVYTLALSFTGAQSCNCLGVVQAPPWVMAAIDAMVVVALVVSRPRNETSVWLARPRVGLAIFGVLLVSMATGVELFVAASRPSELGDEGAFPATGPVALDLSKWVGRRFPLLRHTDIGNQLATGSWVIVLHRHDCPQCLSAVPEFMTKAYEWRRAGIPIRLALVEVPPFGTEKTENENPEPLCSRGRLSADRSWVVGTPAFCRVDEGILTVAGFSTTGFLAALGGSKTAETHVAFHDGFPDYRRFRDLRRRNEFACGPLSLIAALEGLGLPPTDGDRAALIAAAGSIGTDMLQLKGLAGQRGINCVAVAASVADLRHLGFPAIVHLDRVEFAAVLGYETDSLWVAHPGKQPVLVPDDFFAKSYGSPGKALLLSKTPFSDRWSSAEDGKSHRLADVLQADKSAFSVGEIYSYSWDLKFKVRNFGETSVEVRQPTVVVDNRFGCGSEVTASIDSVEIPPSGAAVVCVHGRQKTIGGFTHELLIESVSGVPILRIPLRGAVEHSVFLDRPSYGLADQIVGRAVSFDVPIEIPGKPDTDDVAIEVMGNGPLKADIIRDGAGPLLRVSCDGFSSPGFRQIDIQVRRKSIPDSVPAKVHLTIPVKLPLEVEPPSLWVRRSELRSGWARRLVVSSIRQPNRECAAEWSDPAIGRVVTTTVTNRDTNSWYVDLRPTSIEALLPWQGQQCALVISTEVGSVQVPVQISALTDAAGGAAQGALGPRTDGRP
jgi:hypothetical protein